MNSYYICSFLALSIIIILKGYICQAASYTNNVDYCQLGCTKSGKSQVKHVKCEREREKCGPAPNCKNFRQVPITSKLEKLIANEHNIYRNKVALGSERRGMQPKAANMKALVYNKELGNIAQCWANTCQMEKHSQCNKASNLPHVGQNMAIRSFSWSAGVNDVEKNIKLMIKDWYDEVKQFNNKYVQKYVFNSGTGHYTQMIWGTTEQVGCGISTYKKDKWYNILMVCDYGSKEIGGNLIGANVYQTGQPCSQCPTGTVCDAKFKGLCSSTNKWNQKTNKTISSGKRRNLNYDNNKLSNNLETNNANYYAGRYAYNFQ